MTFHTARLLTLGMVAAGMSLATVPSTALAHPHDLLAQCQLADGTWVMCDQTIHDTLTGKHVKETSKIRGPDKLTTKPRAR